MSNVANVVMFQFRKDVLKIYIEDTDKGYILEVHVQYPEKLNDLHNDLPFCLKEWKFKKFLVYLHDNKNM